MTDFENYVKNSVGLIPSENWIEELKDVAQQTLEIYRSLSEEQGDFAYAEGKWSLKILLEHLTDVEKIFTYRALRFARKDTTELTGFDENAYAKNGTANEQSLKNLIKDFKLNRSVTYHFFSKLNDVQLNQKGIVNGNELLVSTIGKLIVGHNIHHLNIIKERYLPLL
ncbi:MAG TPA: DinB family protein [Flavobacterium sp.]|nr:DinB family protein [Flavobacterium sp.]